MAPADIPPARPLAAWASGLYLAAFVTWVRTWCPSSAPRTANPAAIPMLRHTALMPPAIPPRHGGTTPTADTTSGGFAKFKKSHNGQPEMFGLPTYTSVIVNATAIQRACKAGHGKTTRNAVRKDVAKVKLSKKVSLLGFPVSFLNKNHGKFQGPGDMGGTAAFGIYKIAKNGTYVRVG